MAFEKQQPATAAEVKPQEPQAEEKKLNTARVMETLGTVIGFSKFPNSEKSAGMINLILAARDPEFGYCASNLRVGTYFPKKDIFDRIKLDGKFMVLYTTMRNGEIFIQGLKPYVETEVL